MRRIAGWLLGLGIVAVVFGLAKIHAVENVYSFHGSERLGWAIAYAAILGLSAYGFGLPNLPREQSALFRSCAAAFTGAAVLSLVQLFVGDALLPRFVVFGSALLLVFWYWSMVGLARRTDTRDGGRERVLVVADPGESGDLEAELRGAAERPSQLVEIMTIDVARRTLHGAEPLVDEAVAERVTLLVLSREAQEHASVVEQAGVLHEAGVRVRSLVAFEEEWLGKLPVAELERTSLMFDISEVHTPGYGRLKRLADVLLAIPASLITLLVVPFVLLGDLVGNRGSLLYRQVRVGRDGQPFTILKFRTMRAATAGEIEGAWTQDHDPRVTSFGRLLRRTHLDELPQMWNILRGDISFVGPRPEQPRYVEELVAKIPFYNLRHLVRPGLTGWAQVKYGYAGDERDALEKLQYDFYYLRHQSLAFDGRILGRTIRSVVARGGR